MFTCQSSQRLDSWQHPRFADSQVVKDKHSKCVVRETRAARVHAARQLLVLRPLADAVVERTHARVVVGVEADESCVVQRKSASTHKQNDVTEPTHARVVVMEHAHEHAPVVDSEINAQLALEMEHAHERAARVLDEHESAEEVIGGENEKAMHETRTLRHARRAQTGTRHAPIAHAQRRDIGDVRQRLVRRVVAYL